MTRLARERYVRERFDVLEARFKDRVAVDDPRLLGVLDALGDVNRKRILDLGCGKGRFARRLEERGAEVVGFDISRAMLSSMVESARVQGSASRLPFPDRCFDAAISIEVFEHLPDVTAAIREVRRVLKQGGTFALVDKNSRSLNDRRPWLPGAAVKAIDERRGRWMYPHRAPVRERWFSPGSLRRLLAEELGEANVSFIRSPGERTWVFGAFPSTRRLVLWTARAIKERAR